MSSFCQRVEEICPLLFSVLSIMGKLQQINKRATPIIVALGIVLSVVFGSYDTAKATGMEELFYYTYFDLMSGLFSETGAHFGLKDDYYTKSDRVSGEQVWDNFCTWVEEKAKTLALPVEVVNKTVFNELKDLPNTVTSAGAKMSEKLSELLAKVLPTFNDTNGNQFDTSSANSVVKMITAVCGIQSGLYASSGVVEDVCNGYVLNIVKGSDDQYFIFTNKKGYMVKDYVYSGTQKVWVKLVYVYDGKETDSGAKNALWVNTDGKCSADGAYPYSARAPVTWIIKNGAFAGADGTSLNNYAKVKTVDDNTVYVPGVGYKTNWDIWKDIVNDKVTTDAEEDAWNTRYNLDNDNKDDKEKKKKDNEKDKLPVAIPIIPFKKPDSSDKDKDKDTEQSTEKTSASPIINPKTGNVIDPETGYDIDPETGKLIDPETGKLIDRDMSDTSSKLLKYGDIRKIFPFCIPFDIVDMIRGLRAEKAPPVFHFDYYFKGIDYTFTVDVDLSDYDKYIKLFRGGMVIFFVLALMWLTVKVSKFFS